MQCTSGLHARIHGECVYAVHVRPARSHPWTVRVCSTRQACTLLSTESACMQCTSGLHAPIHGECAYAVHVRPARFYPRRVRVCSARQACMLVSTESGSFDQSRALGRVGPMREQSFSPRVKGNQFHRSWPYCISASFAETHWSFACTTVSERDPSFVTKTTDTDNKDCVAFKNNIEHATNN